MLQILAELVKQGRIGRLDVVNLEAHPEVAESLGVRSVPWLKIGLFELAGVRSREELQGWIDKTNRPDGMADYFHDLLREGQLPKVLDIVGQQPEQLAMLLPIVANPEASINVRIGAGVVFEELAGQPAMAALVEPLGELTKHADARVRADACHYLGMTHAEAAKSYLQTCLDDADAEVREIAGESLQANASPGRR
jgi:hypothetical protein